MSRPYVALLRAVNVGGTGKLPMRDLVALCRDAGFAEVRTYIASGNALFVADGDERQVREALEDRLAAYAGRPVGVHVRTPAELAATVAANPFPQAPPNRVLVTFLEVPLPPAALGEARGRAEEELAVVGRELVVHYPSGQGRTKLRVPGAEAGTARNMNTVARLAELGAALGAGA